MNLAHLAPSGKRFAPVACAASIGGLNLYLARELFFTPHLAYMNSMHGVWIALARLGGDGWWSGGWWPYWDGGMPFEYTYTPLIPGLTAVLASVAGMESGHALHVLMGLVFCFSPVGLFLCSWRITERVGPSWAAALAYSLLSPASVLAPDVPWRITLLAEPRQFYLLTVWDELPHMTALALFPAVLLCLIRQSRRPSGLVCAAAAILMACMMLASAFAITVLLVASLCLWLAADASERRPLLRAGLISAGLAYLIACPFLPPSLLVIMRDAQALHGHGWSGESWLAAAAFAAVGSAIYWLARKLGGDSWMRFLILFAYAASAIVWLHSVFGWRLLPQPARYKVEMEMAWALLVAFGLFRLARALPVLVRAGAAVALLAAGWQQGIHHRQFARATLENRPPISATIEYRAAVRLAGQLPGGKVLLPGSMAQWANAFAPVRQFAGGSWSTAMSRPVQTGLYAVLLGENRDARHAVDWMKAFGAHAVAVSNAQSPEFWRPYRNPGQFEGLLEVLWHEDGTTIYRVPQRSTSMARIVPKTSLVRDEPRTAADTEAIRLFAAALDDPSLPVPEVVWRGPGSGLIRGSPARGQVFSIHVAHHAGWRAAVEDRPVPVQRDGLGQIWLDAVCPGPCEVRLWYDGGVELKVCRWLSRLTLLAVGGFLVAGLVRAFSARV